MRLHFLIFAALSGVPLMAMPYASKVADLLDALDLPRRPAVHEEYPGPFLADIDRLWDMRHEQRATLRRSVPRLKDQAQRTVSLAVDTIRHRLSAAPPKRLAAAGTVLAGT
jgi:polysaccharide pyruvyl transferase WcaK-like protein